MVLPFAAMFLFLVVSPLLAAAIAVLVVTPRLSGGPDVASVETRDRVLRNPALLALAWSVLPILFTFAYVTWVPWHYRPLSLYLYHLFGEHLTITVFLAAGSFLATRRLRDDSPATLHMAHLTFVAVGCTVLAVLDALLGGPVPTLYRSALLPLTRAALVVLLPVAMTVADTARGGGWAVAAIAVYPFVAAVPAMFAEWLRPLAAFGSAIGVAGLVVLAVSFFVFRSPRGGAGAYGLR